MTEPARQRLQQGIAVLWGAVVLLVVLGLVQFIRAPALDTDVLALLPEGRHDARAAQAVEAALGESTAEVLVLLRAQDAMAARQAAMDVREVVREHGVPLGEIDSTIPDVAALEAMQLFLRDRKSTRLNSSHH